MSDLPLPQPGPEGAASWECAREGELRVQRCAECGALHHPPRSMCAECGSIAFEWARMTGHGRVYSCVVTHQPVHPALVGRVPFATVIVELDEGPRVISNVVDVAVEEIAIGMSVEAVFEQAAGDVVLPLFRGAG